MRAGRSSCHGEAGIVVAAWAESVFGGGRLGGESAVWGGHVCCGGVGVAGLGVVGVGLVGVGCCARVGVGVEGGVDFGGAGEGGEAVNWLWWVVVGGSIAVT